VKEHQRLSGILGDRVETLLREARRAELLANRLDLPGDLPERNPELGRLAAETFDLGEQPLESPPIRFELSESSVGRHHLMNGLLAFPGID
jgi:hypothetical protein